MHVPEFPEGEWSSFREGAEKRAGHLMCPNDELRQYLRSQGVETLVHWAKPMWEHQGLALPDPHLPAARRICEQVISLPMSAETTKEHVEITASCTREFFASRTQPIAAVHS